MSRGVPSAARAAAPRPGEIATAAGIVALGLFFFFGAWTIDVLPTYARIGPRFFPYIVGAGLAAAGVLLLIDALRAGVSRAELPENWPAVAWIAAGLVLNVALMERAGYILATTLLFVCAARGLGSRRYIVSLPAGLGLAAATYFAFTHFLDLKLPGGWLEFAIS